MVRTSRFYFPVVFAFLTSTAAFGQGSGLTLVRNNTTTSLNPVTPPLSTLFDPTTGQLLGDQIPQPYAYTFHDEAISNSEDGPLVFYQLSDPNQTLFLYKTGNAQVVLNSSKGHCRVVGSVEINTTISNIAVLTIERDHAQSLFGISAYLGGIVCEDSAGVLSVATDSAALTVDQGVRLLFTRNTLDDDVAFIGVEHGTVLDLFNVRGGVRFDRTDPASPNYSVLDRDGSLATTFSATGTSSCEDYATIQRDCITRNLYWQDQVKTIQDLAFAAGPESCGLPPPILSCLYPLAALGAVELVVGNPSPPDCIVQVPPDAPCSEPQGSRPECLLGVRCQNDAATGAPTCVYPTGADCTGARPCGGPPYCRHALCWTDPEAEFCDGQDNNCDLYHQVDEGLSVTTCGSGACASTGTCSAGVDSCAPIPEGTACDDVGNVCTVGGYCDVDGACTLFQLDCDDNNPCTTDSCNPPSGCVNTPTSGCNASIRSHFDIDAEGSSAVNGAMNFSSSGSVGNPPGSVHAEDQTGGPIWHFAAPQSYLGDVGGFYGGVLRFDIRVSANDGSNSGSPDVILEGAGLELNWFAASPTANTWSGYYIPLSNGGWRKGTGGYPSNPEFLAVLGSVNRLWIRGEFRSGSDNSYLDNVAVQPACGNASTVSSFSPGAETSSTVGTNALGVSDGTYVALGNGGVLVLQLQDAATDGAGPDLLVHEIGASDPSNPVSENYDVDASGDGVMFVRLGTCAGDDCAFDLAGSGLASASYIRITDIIPNGTGSPTAGADIDAVTVVNCN